MTPGNLARLFLLAAIWGGAFLLMRMTVPVFGPVLLIAVRVLLSALLLAAIAAWFTGSAPLADRARWPLFAFVGFFNTALPFLLFAWASRSLSVSMMAILNATAPIFAATVGALWLRQRPSPRVAGGLALGLTGVAIIVGVDPAAAGPGMAWPVLAGLAAACCYGIASTYLKVAGSGLKPLDVAHGSMWAATACLAPLVPFFPAEGVPGGFEIAALATLGIVCTALAYLIYFRLIESAGAMQSLTVTFLIPVFGALWGFVVLDEPIGLSTVLGGIVVLAGTGLAAGVSPGRLAASGGRAEAHRGRQG